VHLNRKFSKFLFISMKDSALANDVFYHAIIKSDLEKTPITLDNVITLLPMVLNLINSKYDVHWINGIRTAHKLLQCIYDVILNFYFRELLRLKMLILLVVLICKEKRG